MIAKIVSLFFLFTTFTSLALAETPKHYVFLVHGIGAGPSTFGHMSETLKKEAQSLDPQVDWQIFSFAYQTGNDTKDVMDFSRELGDYIAEKFQSAGGLNSEDKFSLVMHSQGGLIGLQLLLKSFMNDSSYHPELQDHLDAFVTMGTPYWGAKIAIFANRMLPVLSYLRIPLSDRFGEEELKDMELASDFSAYMRDVLTASENQEVIKRMTTQGRFLVFSGVTERLNLLAPFVTGKNRYEDDTAVPIPSSRLDFLYYQEKEGMKEKVDVSDFKETHMVNKENVVVVNAFHASPFPESSKFPGIAKVPGRCKEVSFRDCNHPTYPYLVEHLFKLERTPSFVRDLTSFAIDLKLNLKGKSIDRKKVAISFRPVTTGLKIGKDVELYNKVSRWSAEGDFRLYHTGYIDPKKTTSTLGKVEMVISAPGFKERTVIVPVKTAQSTYVELNW